MQYYRMNPMYKTTPTIVTWADGTDEQIADMLNAHYAGTIDIHDYWHVGDERVVHLNSFTGKNSDTCPAQDITFVLANEGGVTLNDGVTECAFIIAQKAVLTNGNSGSASRPWYDQLWSFNGQDTNTSTFIASLPMSFTSCLKRGASDFKNYFRYPSARTGNQNYEYDITSVETLYSKLEYYRNPMAGTSNIFANVFSYNYGLWLGLSGYSWTPNKGLYKAAQSVGSIVQIGII